MSNHSNEIGKVVIGITEEGSEVKYLGFFSGFKPETLNRFPRREVHNLLEGLIERGFLSKAPFYEAVGGESGARISSGQVYSVNARGKAYH